MKKFCQKLPFVALICLLWCCVETSEETVFVNSEDCSQEYATQAITRAQADTTERSNGALTFLLQRLNDDFAANIRFLQAFRGKIPLLTLTRLSDSPDYGKAIYVPYSLPKSATNVDGMIVVPIDQDKELFERLYSGPLGAPVIMDPDALEAIPMGRRYLYSKFFSQCRAVWIGTVNERLTDFADRIDNSPNGYIVVPKEPSEKNAMTRNFSQVGVSIEFYCDITSGSYWCGDEVFVATTNTRSIADCITQYVDNQSVALISEYGISILDTGMIILDVVGNINCMYLGSYICQFVEQHYFGYAFSVSIDYTASTLNEYYYGGGSSSDGGSGGGGGSSSGSGGGGTTENPGSGSSSTSYQNKLNNYAQAVANQMAAGQVTDSLITFSVGQTIAGNLAQISVLTSLLYTHSPLNVVVKPNLNDLQLRLVIAHEYSHLLLYQIMRDAGSEGALSQTNLQLYTYIINDGINDGHHQYTADHINEFQALLRAAFPGQNEKFYNYGCWGGGLTNTNAFQNLSNEMRRTINTYINNKGL